MLKKNNIMPANHQQADMSLNSVKNPQTLGSVPPSTEVSILKTSSKKNSGAVKGKSFLLGHSPSADMS